MISGNSQGVHEHAKVLTQLRMILDEYRNLRKEKSFLQWLVRISYESSKVLISRAVVSKVFLLLLLLTTIFLLAVGGVGQYYGIDVAKFTRDPMSVAHGHPFYGFVSNIGAILWSSSMAMCFLTFALLRKRRAAIDLQLFAFSGGVLGVMLLLDDLFMLHEWIYPRNLGIDEKLVAIIYAVLLVLYLIVFFKRIVDTSFVYLFCFLLFFTLSMVVDRIDSSFLPFHFLLEDGFKLLGIVSWLSYHFSVGYQKVYPEPEALAT